MEKLHIGVVGLGMGELHIAAYQKHPRAEVVAVADIDPLRLQEVADQYRVPRRYTVAEEMLRQEQLDVVSIATPNKFHKDLTVAALQAGCHVLCEKPMAMSADEGRQMVAAAHAAARRLMIDFSYRFGNESLALKRAIDAGAIGDVYFARTIWHRRRGVPGFGGWFGQKALSGGGPLIDLGVHRLDLALWLMGYPQPTWVLGATYDPIGSRLAQEQGAQFDVEDLAAAFIRFSNGASLEIEASWAANIREDELMETRLYGTKGGLVQRNLDESYQFEAELFLERDGAHYDARLHHAEAGEANAMSHFVDCIVGDRPHMATGEEGLRVMEILDAIYQSAEQGQPLAIGV